MHAKIRPRGFNFFNEMCVETSGLYKMKGFPLRRALKSEEFIRKFNFYNEEIDIKLFFQNFLKIV